MYDAEKGFKVMPSSFHDIGDVEFQDNWGRFWYDLINFVKLDAKIPICFAFLYVALTVLR